MATGEEIHIMKKIFLIAISVAAGWYGNQLYQQNRLPFVQNSSTNHEPPAMTKCITKDGSVIYGKVPDGIKCKRVEPVKGSVTVLPNTSSSDVSDNKKRR